MVSPMPSRAHRAALLGTLLSLAFAAPALGANIPVAPDGVDSQCTRGGTQPCKTLTRAASLAEPDDTITLAAGGFVEPANVTIEDAGVKVTGAGPGTVVASADTGDTSTITFAVPGAIADLLVVKGTGAGGALEAQDSLDIDRVWALNTAGPALRVVSPGAGDGNENAVTADSSYFSPKSGSFGIEAVSEANELLSTADAISLALRHVTVAGPSGSKGISLDSSASAGTCLPTPPLCLTSEEPGGSIAATVTDSIVAGDNATTPRTDTVANTATLTFTGANLTGDVGNIFWNRDGYALLLRQDAGSAIDKGSASPAAGEPALDYFGDERKIGAATDLGADEWRNLVPAAAFTVDPEQGTVGQKMTFTATSADPDAAGGGGIANYYWDFGDGQFAKTQTPTVEHTYDKEGDKFVRLAVEDNLGAISEPASVKIVVHPVPDLAAPAVEILQPKDGQVLKLRGKKRKGKKRRKPLQLTVLGSVADATGIKQVDVALRLVKRKKGGSPSGGRCEYYGGKRRFSAVDCDEPVWLKVSRTANAWRFRSRKRYRLPPGTYQLRARGTDIVGNVSTAAQVADTLVEFRVK